jgi:Cellulase (glycosyl hydrolase family 5)
MFIRTFSVLLGLCVLAAGPAAAQQEAGGGSGRLSVRGQDILDPSGKPIQLRGWNWGRWGKTEPNDAAENAAQGANVVRIPLRWWGKYRNDEVDSRNDAATATAGIDPANLATLDGYVRSASKARLWIVLFIDSDCGQNGTQDGEMIQYCDPKGEFRSGHNFFTDPAMRAKFVNVWRFIANRYKDTPYLGMFEPFPEPNPPSGSAADISAFYAELMRNIREVAPGVPFLIGGDGYKPENAPAAYNSAFKDVVYTGNLFLHAKAGEAQNVDKLKGRFQTLLDMRSKYNVPIFIQQVGVRTKDDPTQGQVKAVLSALVDNRVGFTYWEYRGSNNPGEFGVHYQTKSGWVQKTPTLQAVTAAFKR